MTDDPANSNLRFLSRGRITLVLGFLFPFAVIPFATVHDASRMLVGITCALAGGLAVFAGTQKGPPARWVARVWWVAAAALALSALAAIPLGDGGRALLQPALAEPVSAVLAMTGHSTHPAALNPWQGAVDWLFAAQVLLLGLGCACVARGVRRARKLSMILIGTGVGLTFLSWAQRVTDASSIFWVSGVPSYAKDPFYGTFVNPNQGGGVAAALVPLTLMFVGRGHAQSRALAIGSASVLTLGAFTAGSRGAVLDWAVGVAVFALLLGDRRLRNATAGLIAATGAVVLALNPRELSLKISNLLAPGSVYDDPFTGRLETWADTLRLVAGVPLLGVGPGGYEDAIKLAKTTPLFSAATHAHNDFLQSLVEHGVPGGMLWIAAAMLPVLLATRRCLAQERGRRRTVLAGFLGTAAALIASASFTFPMHIGAVAVLAALVGGVLLRLSARGEDPRRVGPRSAAVFRWGALALAVFTVIGAATLRLGGVQSRLDPAYALDQGDEAWRYAVGEDSAVVNARALEASSAWYVDALALRPMDDTALLRLARNRVKSGDIDGALDALDLATVIYPTLPFPWLNLARLRASEGDFRGARAAWRGLLSTNLPDEDEANTYLLEAFKARGDAELSVVVDEVLPDRPERLRQAAALLAKADERELAEALFKKTMAIDPEAVASYASHLLQWRRVDEALALVGGIDDSCYAVQVAGRCYLKLQRGQEATERFQRALDICGSDNRKARTGLAQARLVAGTEGAADFAELILTEFPDAHALRRTLIQALEDTHRTGSLKAHLEHLVLEGVATEAENEALIALLKSQ